jgi:glutamine synthetase type III
MGLDLPPIVGDPDGMRVLANALRSTARAVGTTDHSVWSRASVLEFSGPAADRIASEMVAWHGSVHGAAVELNDAADLLMRAAAEVEQQIKDRERLLQAMAEAHAP